MTVRVRLSLATYAKVGAFARTASTAPRAAEYDEKTADRYTSVSQIIDCAKVPAATVGEVCA